jgi:tetratricopeptide (TPR) repeat protein
VEAGVVNSEDREFLRRSLDDLELEHAAGDLSDEDYADLKARYEAKLAGSVSTSRLPETESRHRTWVKPVVTVIVVAVVGVGAGLAMARFSGEREPGEQITGELPTTSQEQLAEAAELFNAGEVVEAAKAYDAVLAENPEDVAALTYKGWMLRNVGVQGEEEELRTGGVELIERALEIDPTFAEAWFFRGIIFLRDENDPDKAVDALRLALANDPIPEIEGAARELLSEIAQSQ